MYVHTTFSKYQQGIKNTQSIIKFEHILSSVQFLILEKSFTRFGYEKRHVFSQFPIPSSYDISDSRVSRYVCALRLKWISRHIKHISGRTSN